LAVVRLKMLNKDEEKQARKWTNVRRKRKEKHKDGRK